jgi:hypothetical protein
MPIEAFALVFALAHQAHVRLHQADLDLVASGAARVDHR